MNYFKGSVAEAIVEAKKQNGIFIVFIYDKSELSQSAREKLNKEEIAQIFSSLKYVAIEIENGSKDAIQFAQIYPLIVVPSLFFISPQNGVPLEVMAGNVDSNTLADKVKNISISINKDVASESPIATNDVQNSSEKSDVNEEKATPERNDRVEANEEKATVETIDREEVNDPIPDHVSNSEAPVESTEPVQESSHASTSEGVGEPSSVPEVIPPSVEDRVTRAKELISQRQEVKANEEMEDENRKEVERRRQTSEVSKARQKREDKERIDLNRQRKKDKEEDRLARERVKAQIAADKAERLARISLLKGEEPPAPARPIQEPPSVVINQQPQIQNRNEITRIKFRFPDNSSELSQFPSEATLMDVQLYLVENGKVPFSKFKLVGTLPPRTFTEAEMPMTLMQLGLSPSAIIIVKPIASQSSTSLEPIRKSVILFLWSMFSPFLVLYQYFRGFWGLGNRENHRTEGSSDEEDVQSSKRPRTEGSFTTRNRPKTAYGRKGESGSFLRREGNIHRLNRRGDEEDDDENNTWNGNSTQQM